MRGRGFSLRLAARVGILLVCLSLLGGNAWGQERIFYKLTLPGALSYEQHMASLVAHVKGFFEEEGIQLNEFILGSGGTLRTAMIAREIDFGLFAFVHVPIARNAGSPWKVVLTTYEREIFSMVVRSELKDRVKTIQDLRGLKVGFSTPGSGAWLMANVYLKRSGLDPLKDVQFLSLGADPAVIYTALKTGRVDAFPTWEPATTRVIEDGVAVPLVRIWEPAQHRQWVGVEKVTGLVLVTREDVISRNPGLVRRVVNAHKKALAFINASKSSDLATLILGNPKAAALFTGLDAADVLRIIDRVKSGWGNGCISRSGFEAEMRLAVEFGLARQAITYEDFADTRFAGACP